MFHLRVASLDRFAVGGAQQQSFRRSMMGLLDQVLGGLLGSNPGGRSASNSPIADVLTELLAPKGRNSSKGTRESSGRDYSESGGLGGLLESFSRSGHGDVADSWVSAGPNRPVEPRQLEDALGRDKIDELARRAGLSRDELLEQTCRMPWIG
jgi:uncharacterized protein YidB (DUF937 family)